MDLAEEYRIYFNTKSLDDALLKTYVTPQIVKETSAYVESIALSYGVVASDIRMPPTTPITMLATYYAYFTAALRKASYSVGKEADKDSFHLKMRTYKELLDDLLSQLSKESFTGDVVSKKRKFPATMPISRN